jgi:hypothetical protein
MSNSSGRCIFVNETNMIIPIWKPYNSNGYLIDFRLINLSDRCFLRNKTNMGL